jgi:hypothetical protein
MLPSIRSLLHDIYFSDKPGGYSSSLGLYKAAKKLNPNVTQQQVRDFLKSNKSYLLNIKTPSRSVIPKSTVLHHANIFAVNQSWFLDTAFLRPSFGNFKYIICQIDYLSKFGRVYCLRHLSAQNALTAFKLFLQDAGNPKLLSIVTDDGSEWKAEFGEFVEESGIQNIKIKQRNKSWLSERFIRTLRSYAARIRKSTKLKDECKIFKLACHQYNLSYSSAIGRSPSEAIIPGVEGETRDFILRKRFKALDKLIPKLDKVEKFFVDDLVFRRIKREQFQKESGRDTLSSIVYRISDIPQKFPFQLFKLQNVETKDILPGSYSFRDIVKKPTKIHDE